MKKMKKVLLMLVSLGMLFSLVACTKKDSGDNKIADGVYTGVGTGKGGDIKVEITIKNDTLEKIDVLEHQETEGFDKAMDTLKDEILKGNTLDVDTVTGCTMTSDGFLEAITNALKEAKATPDMLRDITAGSVNVNKETVEETYDVVVVGAGGAGFSAAIEAKAAGANVVLLEKLPLVGGNTLLSGGEMAVANNWLQEKEGIKDSNEEFKQDILDGGNNIADEELVTVLTENALSAAEWLRDEVGVEFEDELMHFGGHNIKRSLIPKDATGISIIEPQKAKAEEMGIPILLETEATELIEKDGKIVGVKAESKDKSYTFNTNKAVILTTGGFGSNLDMRVKYNPAVDEKILSTNTVGSTGDGIIMAEKVGADLVGMEHIQTYPVCDPITGTLLYFGDSRMYGHAILVNKEGKRFVEELERRDVISMAIKEQTGSVAYQLIDEVGLKESKLVENHKKEMDYLLKEGLLVKADTLEEAAKFFDINVEEFKKTVENYNSYVKDGKDTEFNKRLLTNPISEGPFYLMKAAPAVHHTMGGLKINTNAEVINTEGNVIEGLYAAGELTGGIHGENRLGSDAITDIIVYGRIAGQNAAK